MQNTIWRERKRNFLGLPWTFTVYGFSEDRLFIKSGILSTREDEVRLYRITDVSLYRSLWQRIIGLGTIRVYSADQSLRDFEIKNIPDCENVKEQLSCLVEKERQNKRVTSREFMGDAEDEGEDILE
ncbi:MAG TPA: PH domain-containing protein [Candidatus Avilachnospira avicola]|nr:PH domain-containing protein [Candidatus Avilachnospira avicola]